MNELHAQIHSYLASCHFGLWQYSQALESGKETLPLLAILRNTAPYNLNLKPRLKILVRSKRFSIYNGFS